MAKKSKAFLAIDLSQLEKEWQAQPELYEEYAHKLADARLDLEEEEAKLKVLVAEWDQKVRNKPAKYKIEKESEAAYKNAVAGRPEIQEQEKIIRDGKHRVAILQAAVTALDHRKKALEKLVDLHGQNYFSAPRAKGAAKDARLPRRGGEREDFDEEEDDGDDD